MEMEHMETLCSLYATLLNAANSEASGNLSSVDTQELGEVIDMVKDLAEAKKDCYKACYYKTVIEAMENDSGEYDIRGYHPLLYYPDEDSQEEMERRYRFGYHDEHYPVMNDDPRYGRAYNEYRNSRKHYTETHSTSDKEDMDRHMTEHISDTIATVSEMYRSADPDIKKRIKSDFTKLVADMT